MTVLQKQALQKGNKKRIYDSLQKKLETLKSYKHVMTSAEKVHLEKMLNMMKYNLKEL